ncbi:hypothetical protein CEXT_710261 [Caerostris extrusa]|uniref:Maturase K n=1 Tax=Caerostris extrusa TaxID=172846 RepID=A0AAV4NUX3_CAEEX|nr:hypothetical protein CEXT_710261 [Caerostris extrusa]
MQSRKKYPYSSSDYLEVQLQLLKRIQISEKKRIFPIFNCDSSSTRLIPSVSEYRSPINGEEERHSKNLSDRFKTPSRIQFRKTDSISFEVIAFSIGHGRYIRRTRRIRRFFSNSIYLLECNWCPLRSKKRSYYILLGFKTFLMPSVIVFYLYPMYRVSIKKLCSFEKSVTKVN